MLGGGFVSQRFEKDLDVFIQRSVLLDQETLYFDTIRIHDRSRPGSGAAAANGLSIDSDNRNDFAISACQKHFSRPLDFIRQKQTLNDLHSKLTRNVDDNALGNAFND